MNPIYKFTLAINGATPSQVFPIYGEDLAKEFTMESNEMFFRAKLSGDLSFIGPDFDLIDSANFDAKFSLVVYISYDRTTWTEYWKGKFFKTDCEFDEDDRRIVVNPNVDDAYEALLAGMDKEFNLIDLAPECVNVNYDKRPLVQVYVPGESVVGCFLSGMWWEQECEPVEEDEVIEGTSQSKLIYYYHFYPNVKKRVVTLTTTNGALFPVDSFIGDQPDPLNGPYTLTNGNCTFEVTHTQTPGGGIRRDYALKNNGQTLYSWTQLFPDPTQATAPPLEVPLTGAGGSFIASIRDMAVYCRYIVDKKTSGEHEALDIPHDDMVGDNRNYKYCLYYNNPSAIIISTALTNTPTKYGIYQPGRYFEQPYDPNLLERVGYPVARSAWARESIWFRGTDFEHAKEVEWRTPSVLKDAYPLSSAISVLLGQIAPSISHQNNTNYSQFLYATNPITGINQTLIIAPKSNVVNAGYDQPAQKALIKLSDITSMLRDCFRCYWFLDGDKFRIEHVEYFRNGGSYLEYEKEVGRNLTLEKNTRNSKSLAFATSKYKFSKPEMAARYEFGWMDDVTDPFDGNPIDILSNFVNQDNVEKIDVGEFTSDIDYILLNPNAISKDGFVLLGATYDGGYVLPYYYFAEGAQDYYLQNGWVSFRYLQMYYMYDMPAENIRVNGVQVQALGTKKLKSQEISFPCLYDVNVNKLIKTNIGDGEIQKISINLSSRNAKATLMYDTE